MSKYPKFQAKLLERNLNKLNMQQLEAIKFIIDKKIEFKKKEVNNG